MRVTSKQHHPNTPDHISPQVCNLSLPSPRAEWIPWPSDLPDRTGEGSRCIPRSVPQWGIADGRLRPGPGTGRLSEAAPGDANHISWPQTENEKNAAQKLKHAF